jgi:hypothetical protein
LNDVTSKIVDLPGDLLGMTGGRSVRIDVDAQGYGWFIAPAPWESSEFE